MDNIQKYLIKNGRSDLAKEYYDKFSALKIAQPINQGIVDAALKNLNKHLDEAIKAAKAIDKLAKMKDAGEYFKGTEMLDLADKLEKIYEANGGEKGEIFKS